MNQHDMIKDTTYLKTHALVMESRDRISGKNVGEATPILGENDTIDGNSEPLRAWAMTLSL
jgi:hypothetical protein